MFFLNVRVDYAINPIAENLSPGGNYMLKVNNKNDRTRCEICSKLTIKT